MELTAFTLGVKPRGTLPAISVDDEPSDDRPDDVPPKATITVKKINNNRYYYWQWREGEKIESKYKGPVE